MIVNQEGLVVAFESATANVTDNNFKPQIEKFEDEMIIFSDEAFHSAEGDPKNLKLCKRGAWNDRMMVETTSSMITLISHFKRMLHRVWAYFEMRLSFSMAMFNVLASWYGLQYDTDGVRHLSIAEFSL